MAKLFSAAKGMDFPLFEAVVSSHVFKGQKTGPWCSWLGADTPVQAKLALQPFCPEAAAGAVRIRRIVVGPPHYFTAIIGVICR